MTAASSVAYTVRQLEARDLPVLQQSQLADWTPANALSATREYRVLVLQREQDEEVAGIAEYQRILDEGSLLGIAIVPALQRRGLGLCLLLGVLDAMRAQGCVRCLLEVRRSNGAAQALYQRAQFTLDGVRKDYYPPLASGQSREDALLYSRLLR